MKKAKLDLYVVTVFFIAAALSLAGCAIPDKFSLSFSLSDFDWSQLEGIELPGSANAKRVVEIRTRSQQNGKRGPAQECVRLLKSIEVDADDEQVDLKLDVTKEAEKIGWGNMCVLGRHGRDIKFLYTGSEFVSNKVPASVDFDGQEIMLLP